MYHLTENQLGLAFLLFSGWCSLKKKKKKKPFVLCDKHQNNWSISDPNDIMKVILNILMTNFLLA